MYPVPSSSIMYSIPHIVLSDFVCICTAANFTIHFVYHCSYSLYEPNHTVLREYKGGLEKAILRNSLLLEVLNDTLCKTYPWLAQKV